MGKSDITIKVLGTPEIRVNDTPVKLPFRQAEAMIYYLAVNGAASRERLCDLLWGDRYPEDKAKSSLRNAVCVVRGRLGRDFLVEPSRQHISLNPELPIQVDAAVYLQPGEALGCAEDFLSGFHLKDNEVFDDWAAATAQSLRDAYCTRAKAAVSAAYDRNDTERCFNLCRELIAANEYDEFGYRYLMLCLSRKQDYGAALELYQQLKKLLAEDLFQEPEAETEQTARDIRELRRAALSNLPMGRPLRGPEPPRETAYGREPEARDILSSLDCFFRGLPASSLLIRGEMGVGKTFLLEHILRHTDPAGGRVVAVRCYNLEMSFPLKPWYDILTQLISSEEETAPMEELRRAMAVLLPQNTQSVPSYAGRETTYLIRALLACCETRRLLVAIDDLQWADPASLSLIHNIVTLDRNRSILFLLTCRSEPAPEADALVRALRLDQLLREHPLSPFTYTQTSVLARTLLPDRGIDEDFTRRLYQESDGNPLFITECLNSIRFGGGMTSFTPHLTDIIRQRIDALSPDAARLLELISIAPDGADFDMLAAISQRDEFDLAEMLESLLNRQLIREDLSGGKVAFSFVHQKIMEYTYDHISSIRRRLLHGKMAAYLESRLPREDTELYDYSRLIYHFERSGQLLKYLKYVVRNIAGYLSMAHEFFPPVKDARPPLVFQEEQGISVLNLDDLSRYLNGVEKRILENPQIFRQPEAASVVSQFYILQAQYYEHQVDYPPAFAYVQKLRELNLPAETPEQRQNLLKANYFLTSLYMNCYDIPALQATVEESLQLLGSVEDPETRATWLRLQGMCQVMSGDCQAGYQRLQSTAELFLAMENPTAYAYCIGACWTWMAEALRLQGDFDGAGALYQQAVSLCEGSQAGGTAVFYTLYARCLLDQDPPCQPEKAEIMLSRARGLCTQFHLLWYRAVTFAYSALAACRKGSYSQGREFLREAYASAKKLRNAYEQRIVDRIAGRIRAEFPEALSPADAPAEAALPPK